MAGPPPPPEDIARPDSVYVAKSLVIDEEDGMHNRGLFAARDFEPGAVVFRERPYLSHHDNAFATSACAHCLAPTVGSFEAELELANEERERDLSPLGGLSVPPAWQIAPAAEPDRDAEASGGGGGGDKKEAEGEEEAEEDDDDSEGKGDPSHRRVDDEEKKDNHGFPRKPVPCRGKCGLSYCSPACERRAYVEEHRLLCVGPVEDDAHPLIRYKEHLLKAEISDAMFGAKLAANAILRSGEYDRQLEKTGPRRGAGDRADARARCSLLYRVGLLPFLPYTRPLWWECAEPSNARLRESVRAQLFEAMQESHELLREAWQGRAPEGCEALVEGIETYARFMGMLHRNSMLIKLPNPLHAYLEALLARREDWSAAERHSFDKRWGAHVLPRLRAIRARMLEHEAEHANSLDEDFEDCDSNEAKARTKNREEGLDYDNFRPGRKGVLARLTHDDVLANITRLLQTGEEGSAISYLLPPIEGSVMLPLGWYINHSCEPNVAINFAWSPGGGDAKGGSVAAEVVALRKLRKDEELCISYLSDAGLSMNVVKRRKSLQDYGFVCSCQRCSAEIAKQEQVGVV